LNKPISLLYFQSVNLEMSRELPKILLMNFEREMVKKQLFPLYNIAYGQQFLLENVIGRVIFEQLKPT